MTNGIKAKDIRAFEKYANKLSEVLARIRSYNPEANIYVACDTMNLMGRNDDGLDKETAQTLVAASVRIDGMDCGDW